MTRARLGVAAALVASVAIGLPVETAGQGLRAVDVPSTRPTPRMADGRPDFSGYWKGTTDTTPVGNIGKDLPGWELPLTPAGKAALEYNLTSTVDPEALCIIGGIPRHNASGLPFEILQGASKIVFMYWYSYFRLIPIDPTRTHSEDTGSVVLRRGARPLGGRHPGHRLDRLQGREGLDRRERQPAQRRAARRRTLDETGRRSHPRRDAHRGSEVLHETRYLLPDVGARAARRGDQRVLVQREQRAPGPSWLRPRPHRAGRATRVRQSGTAAASASEDDRREAVTFV